MITIFRNSIALSFVICFHIFLSAIALAQRTPVNRTGDLPIEIVPSVGGVVANPFDVSADGKLAVLRWGNGIEIWDIGRARLVRRLAGLNAFAEAAALSTDGKYVAATTNEMTKIWQVESGSEIDSFGPPLRPSAIRFSADSTNLILAGFRKGGSSGTLVAKNIQSGRFTPIASGDSLYSLGVSPDGKLIVVGGDGVIKMFASDGRALRTIRAHQANVSNIYTISFSPDGQQFATAGYDKTIRIWNSADGKPVRVLQGAAGRGEYNQFASWSPDGKTIAATGDGESTLLKFWNTQTGALERTAIFQGKYGNTAIGDSHYLPDGKSLLVGTYPFRRVDLKDFRTITEYGRSVANAVASVASEGADVFLQSSDGNAAFIEKLDLLSGAKLRMARIEGIHLSRFSASRSGLRIGALGNKGTTKEPNQYPVLIDETAQATPKVLPIDLGGFAFAVAMSPDGELMAAASDKTIVLIDTKSGHIVRRMAHAETIWSLDFSPDGRSIVAGDWKTLRIWQVATGSSSPPFKSPSQSAAYALKFSKDGRSFFESGGDYGSSVNQWSAEGRFLRNLKVPGIAFGGISNAIDTHPNGQLVLIGSFDANVHLWTTSGQFVRSLRGHFGAIAHAKFAMQGERIISGANDGIKIWKTDTGELLASYLKSLDGEWVMITPEGFFDASEKGAQNLSMVRGLEVYSIDQVYQTLFRPDLVREKLAGDPKGLVREAAAKLDLTKVMASGAAPKVTILTPAQGAVNRSDDTQVEAEIADAGGGIGKVEWRVNGITLGVEERGLARIEVAAGASSSGTARPPLKVSRALALEPGDNVIEIVAYNGRNLIASDPARVTVKWDGSNPATPPKLHVLAVGVNDYYDSRLKLSFAVPDVKALSQAMKTAGGGLYSSVEITNVLDAEVTLENLDKVFTDVGKKIHPRDVFVFFLAGHGKTVDGKYYFLPRDFRYDGEDSIVKKGIDQDKFQNWFSRIAARKSILLYDTCESGSLTGDRVQQRGIERVAALEKMTRAMGRTVLSASTDDAPALEGYKGHGVFTYALLEGVGAADTNGNGMIEVTELASYIDQKVPELSFAAFKQRQIPQMKIVGSNFALANKISVIVTPPATAVPTATIAAKPTHVVILSSPIRQSAAMTAAATGELEAGTQVTLVETQDGWAIVAREGRRLGYVEERSLATLR